MSYRLRKDAFTDAKADTLVRKAADEFSVPQSAIALVGRSVVYFLAAEGTPFRSVPREISFCGYAIHSRTPLIVPDATLDPRFADNPLVNGAPFVRFYAGAPLVDRDGLCLGTFCIVDTAPRALAPAQIAELQRLSETAMRRIDFLSSVSELLSQPAGSMLV
jgi:GAF domain-containing protein